MVMGLVAVGWVVNLGGRDWAYAQFRTFCARNCTFFAQIASFLQGPEGSLRRAGLGLGQGAQTQVGSPSLGLLGLPNLAPF